MKKITILIPLYNEEDSLRLLHNKLDENLTLLPYQFEFLFVNDGSKDNSLDIIKSLKKKDNRVNYVSLSRNYGKEIALIAGIDKIDSDAMVIIDADLQHPIETIPTMLEWFELGYDDVYAKRVSRKGESIIKKLFTKIFYFFLKKISKITILENVGDFRLLSRKAIEALKQFRENERYTKGLFSLIGYKKKEITFEVQKRVAGKTKWNFFKLFDLGIRGITTFSTAPLRLASIIGILCSLSAFVYMFIVILYTLFHKEDVPGYPSLMSVILFLGGVQLISIGILGEYIATIFIETKKRPIYLIDETSFSNVPFGEQKCKIKNEELKE